jgi:DNA adenine methylase
MILTRLGNKRKLAGLIESYFPTHTTYIEPFFGAGGMYFHKKKAKTSIVNDLDGEVFNLWDVIQNQKDTFMQKCMETPLSEELFKHWKDNPESDPLSKAMRFVMLSNFSYLGKGETFRFNGGNTFKLLIEGINTTSDMLRHVEIMNASFEEVFKKISFRDSQKNKTLVYCDPPYLNTANNYSSGFTQEQSLLLFDTLENCGCHWFMSEFDQPFILEQAKKRGLYVIELGERRNLNNRRVEILVTNYKKEIPYMKL